MSAPVRDRLKDGFLSLVRAALPTVDYFALYRARVVAQSSDGSTVDLQPDDKRLPGLKTIPLQLGLPGVVVKFGAGAKVLLGWENGDPSRPYAMAFAGGESVMQVTLTANKIELGGGPGLPVDAVVVGATPCQFTGAPHLAAGSLSKKVFCK